jgi:arylsulfatase
MTYYAEQSCTSGRTGLLHRHDAAASRHDPAAAARQPVLSCSPGTPALAKFLLDLGYNTAEFGKNHLGDHSAALPTAHGFQEFWGYLYHLDAMQQVSFPDINKTPTDQAIVPAVQEHAGARPCRSPRARWIRRQPFA